LEQIATFPWIDLQTDLKESLEVITHRKKLQIQWPDLENTTPIPCDRMMLTQALHNLLLNAAEHSPLGGHVQFELHQNQTGFMGKITDEGEGIPDFALSRLFDKFYSLPKPGTGRKGTGLGLAFVQQTLRLHSGGVEIKNRPSPKKGAEVSFHWNQMNR